MADSNQNQAQQNTDAQRRAAADQQDAQRRAGSTQGTQQQQDAARQSTDASRRSAEQANRQNLEQTRRARAEYPQDSGGGNSKPTPTQDENDEIRAGLRHIDDKEDDGSGPDPKFAMRRVDANAPGGKYETR